MLEECTFIHIGHIKSNTDVVTSLAFVCEYNFHATGLFGQFSPICLAICFEDYRLLVLHRACAP